MQNRYFENPQGIPENTVPPPEMVGMITTIAVKVNPEREDSETRTVRVSPSLVTALSRFHVLFPNLWLLYLLKGEMS